MIYDIKLQHLVMQRKTFTGQNTSVSPWRKYDPVNTWGGSACYFQIPHNRTQRDLNRSGRTDWLQSEKGEAHVVVLSMSDIMLYIYTPEESFLLKFHLLVINVESMINNLTHSSANLSSFIVFLRPWGALRT